MTRDEVIGNDIFIALLETNNDISERKRAEEALNKAQAELAHLTRMMTMGELAASIAHEVNQPLTAVITNANACTRWLAGQTPNLGEAREAISRIVRDGNRASEVIKRIRAMLKKTAPQKSPLDVNGAIREVIALAQSELRRSKVLLKADLAADSLLQELESTSWAGKAYADLLATALAVHLLRKHALESPLPPSYSGGMPKYKLRRAVEYISDKLGGELRVAEIADEVNMSPYHFTRLFKQATGLAPHQYIMQKRIEMAKKFLVETELPIAQIALETGFQSQSRFTTLFRQITGTTPRAYRGQNTYSEPSHQTLRGAPLSQPADRYLNVA